MARVNGKTRESMLFESRIDLSDDLRYQMIDLLNRQLADTFNMFSLAKQAHWNVKGSDFFQLHELYDVIAEELLGYVDQIAERITTLGGVALGTVKMAANLTSLQDFPEGGIDSMKSVQVMADRLSKLTASTREALQISDDKGDLDTSDLLIEVSRGLDKRLWFLEAHLQKGSI
jgi:starvation-inducible DNA-binding protein